MNERKCFCGGHAPVRLTKGVTDYFQCEDCGTLFSDPLDNSNMVGGGFEEERNSLQNQERIDRFILLTGIYGRILDFGCGHGKMVKFCNDAKFVCDGYDKFNPEYEKMPNHKYNLITLVEVIEHTSSNFLELDLIHEKLTDNGIVYLESSFTDVAEQENIPLEEFFYIEPAVGHSTLFSHKGLDLLMISKGFTPKEHINRNVRIYQKN